MSFQHTPVLLQEVITWLKPQPGHVMVDCTAGGGGHSLALLTRVLPGGRIIALDQDMDAVKAVMSRLLPLGKENFTVIHTNFRHLKKALQEINVNKVCGILFDLGVSSYQLDEGERGFSYQQDASLDMRMDRTREFTAYDLVNKGSQEELIRILYEYGEERWAKRIVQFIVREREQAPIETTGQLVDIIKGAIPSGARREGPHPAKRTFQALRIAVNRELEILEEALEQGMEVLEAGGRMAVITFHSLEDRITKRVFQKNANSCTCPKDLPQCICNNKPQIKILTGKPITATEDELQENPRARSAKLRVVEKIDLF